MTGFARLRRITIGHHAENRTGPGTHAPSLGHEAVLEYLEDAKIVGDRAKALGKVAGRGGMGADQVGGINRRFLELKREAAFADDVLTVGGSLEAEACSRPLGRPIPDDPRRSPTTVWDTIGPQIMEFVSSASAPKPRKCGHCRTPGLYGSNCPGRR